MSNVLRWRPSTRLPLGSRFFDVEDTPVALMPTPDGGIEVRAFDSKTPRGFPYGSVANKGAELTAAAWDDLVDRSEAAAWVRRIAADAVRNAKP